MKYKICISCSMCQPLEDYYKNHGMKDGHLNKCKSCLLKQGKEIRLKHIARDPAYGRLGSLQRQHRFHFGGNREAALKRDNYRCVNCSMTQMEHKNRWNRSLTVDHIDGLGLHVSKEEKNNDLDNLQTLCLKCHGHKDVKRRKVNVVV